MARLRFVPLGPASTPYPPIIRALRGVDASGVYLIRARTGARQYLYVGESHTGRLYSTLTRHFQGWSRGKTFWRGLFGNDPGVAYPRDKVLVAVVVTDASEARAVQDRLIARLAPRDNLALPPAGATTDVDWIPEIPF